MEEKQKIKVSVRDLVEFVLMNGDIVSGFTGSSRNLDAIKAHQLIQKSYGEGFTKEVPLSFVVESEDILLEVGGRIDGLYVNDKEVIIDEIKTTTQDLKLIEEEHNVLHWAQAKCYGYIYSMQNSIQNINIQLTYYNLEEKNTKKFLRNFNITDLQVFFSELVEQYFYWAKLLSNWNIRRNEAIKKLDFPFPFYRKGQREFAVAVYKTVKEGNKLFAQAPTGIGKTMATIFPSLKALEEGHITKIFYLTAKTITRTIAEKALRSLSENGLRIKSLTLTAKEKICFKEKAECNSETCEYAKGHYDRVKTALEDIFSEDFFTREVIEEYSRKHRICPFEFSLDLSNFSDCIICDYNYVFDPSANLKRFFLDKGGDYVFLIDEAHNLVDRAREMFSSELSKKSILDLKKKLKTVSPSLSKGLNKINSIFIEYRKKCEEENAYFTQKEAPKELYGILTEFLGAAEKYILEHKNFHGNDDILDLYFKFYAFLRAAEYYDERFITYVEKKNNDVIIKMFCLDPSYLLKECMKKGKAAILFSATLSPMDYFMSVLGGDEKSYRIRLTSPFPKENLCLMLDSRTSTKYKDREFTYNKISEAINSVISGKQGNYLIFFPSYQYMNEVYNRFKSINEEIEIIIQNPGMTEEEKETFLDSFSENNNSTMAAFAVMGGMFGEGIDLTGDKLSGAVIVGVGLPQICLERNIIKDYFNEIKGLGFEYAYVYPGMNKVLQAVGRVIRTENDRGVVLLIDERFSNNVYRRLFPTEWRPIKVSKELSSITRVLDEFWEK
ncbi:ATP-dependent DNA helicase [Candidatus Clostridium stratigraminis]|uniref:ATP-dependent DNA helicase n=1 Tax=Candidatus Clostridium stratigraminis TaxID=3381661 RepID=A0ABW8T1W1_9CLOT